MARAMSIGAGSSAVWLWGLLFGATSAWSDIVALGEMGEARRPSVVATQAGVLHLVYEEALDSIGLERGLRSAISADSGALWSVPEDLGSFHFSSPSLLQRQDGSFVLFFDEEREDGRHSLKHAISDDGRNFNVQWSPDLGGSYAGQAGYSSPYVIRGKGGAFTMIYSCGRFVCVAQSFDEGVTWDQLGTRVETELGYHHPRIAYRASDQRYWVTYGYDTYPADIGQAWSKTTTDIHDWSAPRVALPNPAGFADPMPTIRADGDFALFYSRTDGRQSGIYERRSTDAVVFGPERARVVTSNGKYRWPYVLNGPAVGELQLFWTDRRQGDFGDLYREQIESGVPLFGDGFE